MHFFPSTSTTPDVVSLSSVNELANLRGKVYILHNMVGDTTKASFGKSYSANNV